jgi:hypothetical protein
VLRLIGVALVVLGSLVVLAGLALFGFVGWLLVSLRRHGATEVSRRVHESPPPIRTDAQAAERVLRDAGLTREVGE